MNPIMLRGLIESAIRWALPFIYGAIAYEPTAEATNEIVAFLIAALMFVVSLVWSLATQKRAIKAPPPANGLEPKLFRNPNSFGMVMLLLGAGMLLVFNVGCGANGAGPSSTFNQDELLVTNSAANSIQMIDENGTWSASTQGRENTGVVVDGDGLNQLSAGPHMTTGLVAGEARLFSSSPTGLTIASAVIDFNEDGTVRNVTINGLSSDPAVAIEAYNEQVVQTLVTQGDITQVQGAVLMEMIRAGATAAELTAQIVRMLTLPVPVP